jgi:hypothetical protein
LPVSGIIGHELFRRFVVTIDYAHQRLGLTLPSAFSHTGPGTPVPLTFNGSTPALHGEVDGRPGRFDLDTGSRGGLTLSPRFAEVHRLAESYRAGHEALTGWGVGGATRGRAFRVGVLRLGGVDIARVIGELSVGARTVTDPDVAGTVGGGVLKRFNVTFDYSRSRVIFERNANDSTPDAPDRAGLWLNLANEAFEVADVQEESPGADAGIAVGDRILALDGRRPPGLTLAEARHALRAAPGTRVRLTVEVAGGPRETVIVLRELV